MKIGRATAGVGRSRRRRSIDRLAPARFDAASCSPSSRKARCRPRRSCFLAGIPRRAAHCRENPYALLTDWRRRSRPRRGAGVRHEVQRQLDLVASLGASVRRQAPAVPGARRRRGAAMRAQGARQPACTRDRPWLIVHPGATRAVAPLSGRRLPRRSRSCSRAGRWQIGVAGARRGSSRSRRRIAAQARDAVPLAGLLDLPELAALMQAAQLLVCNNTAPAHIAAAVGTPVVDLYALTNPQHTPWRVPHRVLSHDVPCRNCLKSVCPHGHHAASPASRPPRSSPPSRRCSPTLRRARWTRSPSRGTMAVGA